MDRLIHLLSGVEVGGLQRVVLRLAVEAQRRNLNHTLLLFDTSFRNADADFDPGPVPIEFISRCPGLDWRFPWRLAQWVRRQRVEIVHAHNDTAIFYAALARRLIHGHKPALVGTFHTRPTRYSFATRFLTRWAGTEAAGITAVSPEMCGLLVESGWISECCTIWNGVDLEEFSPCGETREWRRRLEIPNGNILVGHVGRFAPVKRQADLLAAVRLLGDQSIPITFVFVGDGPLLQSVRHEAAGLANVRFVPRVTDMAAFMRALDIFVICSEHEGAPMVLLEAMACGRAVVATAAGSMPEMLTTANGDSCGVIVPSKAPEKLGQAISCLSLSAATRRRFGSMARERARDFSFEAEWSAYAALYRRIQP